MISVTRKGIYHLTIYSDKVTLLDYFRLATYTAFRGEAPTFFQSVRRTTSIVDLSQTLDDIFQHMKSNYRNEIRKAMSIGIVMELENNTTDFIKYYNEFASKRGLEPISDANIIKYPEFYITKAVYDGRPISYHAYIVDRGNGIARLLYSASNRLDDDIDTKIIGFGNKYLHYKDFEFFKEKGLNEYDFAGVCEDPNDKEKYGIGQFKKGFGGAISDTVSYNSPLMALSLYIKSKL